MIRAFLPLLFLIPGTLTAQGVTVSGVVRDAETEEPIPSAHVLLIGSDRGTVTSKEGRFRIVIASSPAQLRVSAIGYRTKTRRVSTCEEDLSVDLEPVVYALSLIHI